MTILSVSDYLPNCRKSCLLPRDDISSAKVQIGELNEGEILFQRLPWGSRGHLDRASKGTSQQQGEQWGGFVHEPPRRSLEIKDDKAPSRSERQRAIFHYFIILWRQGQSKR